MAITAIAKRLGMLDFLQDVVAKRQYSSEIKKKVFKGYQPTRHDIFATIYSKSGTNWIMQIVQQLLYDGEAEFGHIHEVVAWPEAPFQHIVPLEDPGPWQSNRYQKRLIKAAAIADYVPYSEKARYITVIRDPKEVVVSAFNFIPSVFGMQGYVTIEQWLDRFLSPNFIVGCWAEHTAGFWAMRDRPNVLVLFFSDLKQDPEGSIRKIADHIGVELSAEVLAKVKHKSHFQYMKEHEEQFGPPILPLVNKKRVPKMLRSGKSGASGELLSQAQQDRVDQYFMQRLAELRSDFPYRERFLE